MKVDIELVRVRLREPFMSATGSVSERELLLLRLEDSEGQVGMGEAAPLFDYDGVRLEHVRAALEACRATLARASGLDRAELLAECARVAVLPQAVAAVDLALWDIEGRRTGQPVWRLLAGEAVEPVEVNYTIAAFDRAGAQAQADEARAAGYRCLKVKVGSGDDAGLLAAVRAAAGAEMAIRIDANGAWSLDEALAALGAAMRALRPLGIELCEEPVRGLEQIRRLSAATVVPLSIDESASLPGALDSRVCQAVCLKIARSGGITGLLDAARRARATGYEVYLASTLDGPLGIAAALHSAAVLRPRHACGLATLGLFDRKDPLPPRYGRIKVPGGPGLGDGLADWYRA